MGLYFLMITETFGNISAAAIITFGSFMVPQIQENILASHEISLEYRYPDKRISEIFKDNILLNIAYMDGKVTKREDINWDEIRKPFKYEFRLNPGQTFAYHDDILPQFNGKVTKTTNAHFNWFEGFKSSGYLYGDGVCHLASLIYWVAKDAGLDAYAPTNHNFMNIPEIPKEYGVSIFSNPYIKGNDAMQNLYITNNKGKAITFKFDYIDENLRITVVEEN